jgi:hypothetical protein
MKQTLITTFFFIITIFSYAQSKQILYVDENFNKIDFNRFQKKLDSKLFDIAIVENDTATFKKLRYAEFYGQLNSKTKKQLSLLLNKRLYIDTTKVIQVHFIDSLPNVEKLPKQSGIEFLDTQNNPTGIFLTSKEFRTKQNTYPYTKHKHILSKRDYINSIEKEYKSVRKNVELVHLFNENKGIPLDKLSTYNYHEDPNSLISKLFSDKMKMFKSILIHPNGEFYVSRYSHGSFLKERKLTKKSIYDKQKKKWLKKLKKTS